MTDLAEEAARAFGGSRPRLIANRENAVYEVHLPAGKVALRLHRQGYQSEMAIRSELWWCEALATRGVPVARCVAAKDGAHLVRLSSGQFASAVHWVEGQPMGEAGLPLTGTQDDQIGLHAALGRMLAQMHNVTEGLDLPTWFIRPRWDLDGLVGEAPFWGRFWEHPALSRDEARLARQTRAFLRDRLHKHGALFAPRLVHADVLRENVFSGPSGLSLIDFDDCGIGFPLYDLGTAMSQNLKEPALPALAHALIAGYSETRTADPDMVAVFTLMRCCASIGWIIPRLAPDDPIIRRYIDRMTDLAQVMLDGQRPW